MSRIVLMISCVSAFTSSLVVNLSCVTFSTSTISTGADSADSAGDAGGAASAAVESAVPSPEASALASSPRLRTDDRLPFRLVALVLTKAASSADVETKIESPCSCSYSGTILINSSLW